jgi:hypothetical protein
LRTINTRTRRTWIAVLRLTLLRLALALLVARIALLITRFALLVAWFTVLRLALTLLIARFTLLVAWFTVLRLALALLITRFAVTLIARSAIVAWRTLIARRLLRRNCWHGWRAVSRTFVSIAVFIPFGAVVALVFATLWCLTVGIVRNRVAIGVATTATTTATTTTATTTFTWKTRLVGATFCVC